MPASTTIRSLTLVNEQVSVRMLPDLGGKLCSLRDRRTGREWLLPSQLAGGGYRNAAYGDDFSTFDTSGFDECFPVVGAGPHPDAAFQWPDHGELWSRAWEVEQTEDALMARIDGQVWPYTFSRRASLQGDSLCLDYTVENRAAAPFRHLWSAHPLLQVTPGMKLLLPQGLREVVVNGRTNLANGNQGDLRHWPEVTPGLDCSTVPPVTCGKAMKVFAPWVSEGWCGVMDPVSGEALTFHWNPAEVPHLGLWLCYGGWPTDGRTPHLTVALEPCTGMPDRLDDAAERNSCAVLGPGERKTWNLRLQLHTQWPMIVRSGVAP